MSGTGFNSLVSISSLIFGGRLTFSLLAGLCLSVATLATLGTIETPALAQKPSEPILLWPGVAPGDAGIDVGAETETTPIKPDENPATYISRVGKVTKPTITLYRPSKEKANGAAVVVCPGGGYSILAMNLEGTEVCTWLNSIGVTAILLKYRVPVRPGQPRYQGPLQDAQRAIGIVRHRATEWGIDPHRIGILGFSAGGHLSAAASTNYDARTYPQVDDADKESSRPDFTVLIYPAYLTHNDDLTTLAPEIKVNAQTPQAFIAMTQDDPVHVQNAFVYATALTNAKVPAELHIFPKGGHGYGLRPSPNMVSHWPQRVEGWLTAQGLLKK